MILIYNFSVGIDGFTKGSDTASFVTGFKSLYLKYFHKVTDLMTVKLGGLCVGILEVPALTHV